MLKMTFLSVFVAAAALLMPRLVYGYGAAHVGYTHVGPSGVYHTGETAYRGPGGAYAGGRTEAYGRGGAEYHSASGGAVYHGSSGGAAGGYHYSSSYYGGAHYGYVR